MGGRTLGDDFDDVPDLDLGPAKGAAAKDAQAEQRRASNAPGVGGGATYGGGGGMVFDDDDALGGGGPSLELDVLPSSHTRTSSGPASAASPSKAPGPTSVRSMPAPGAMPSGPPSQRSMPAPGATPSGPPSQRSVPAGSFGPQGPVGPGGMPMPAAPPPPRDPAAILADYGAPPAKLWQAPFYAYRVLSRQAVLKQDLAQKRSQRSPEVPLYEAALRAHDARAVTQGIIVGALAIFGALLLFCSPVIVRFVMLALHPVD